VLEAFSSFASVIVPKSGDSLDQTRLSLTRAQNRFNMPVDEGGEIDANVTVDEATAAAAYAAALEAPWRTELLDELLDKFRGASPQLPPLISDGRSDIPNNRPTLTLTAVHRQ